MLNLDEVFMSADASINEAKKTDVCELDRVCTTFADIRDAVKAAAKDVFRIEPAPECVTAYITCKDGNFIISPDSPRADGEQLKSADSGMWKLPKQQRSCMDRTLKDIYGAVSGLDGRLFGNGRSYLKCVMTPPPDGRESEYGDKFPVVFPEVARFDAGMNKLEGEPEESAEILAAARKCPCAARTDAE